MPILATNKRATFDYEILEKFEAGLVLTGQEVKAVRNGQASLNSSYVTANNQTATLLNASISPYKMAGTLPNYNPSRTRKLLLHKKELGYLTGKTKQSGLTLVPLSLYTKGKKIKLEFALAKGKKLYDKRRTIKEREAKRKVLRALKTKFR
ncbi:MAG: SsrA-binding protein SmpB [Candidatus Parcubacteria bacterium]|nr:SsrA-binding protein SmpB [Candidatus Parcubacteria bacterium]